MDTGVHLNPSITGWYVKMKRYELTKRALFARTEPSVVFRPKDKQREQSSLKYTNYTKYYIAIKECILQYKRVETENSSHFPLANSPVIG